MRPRSIVAPILLIAFGALFLANNLRPDLPMLRILGTYWPFLLIGWGVMRLVEIFTWRAQGRPLPRYGISGGEWILAVFLTMFGTSILYGSRFSHDWPRGIRMRGLELMGEPFEYPLAGTRTAASPTPKILIESFRGNIRLTGVDSNEVKITGRKQIRTFNRDDADRNDKATPFELVSQGDMIIVRMNHDHVSDSARIKADLEIQAPKGSSFEARGRFGDFDLNDIQGSVDITSDNAGVRMNNIGGAIRLDLRRSDLVRVTNVKNNVDVKSGHGGELEFDTIDGALTVIGDYYGDMQFRAVQKVFRYESPRTRFRVEKVPGQIRMNASSVTGSNLNGPITLSSNAKDVEFSDFTNSLEVSVNRGDLEIRPGRLPVSKIDATTKGGRVDIALPPPSKFELTATTDKGQVENEWGDPLRAEENGRRSKLSGSTGAGAVITAHTDRGNVIVRKATATAEIPSPPRSPNPPKPPKTPAETEL